jgi:hypothetical protein
VCAMASAGEQRRAQLLCACFSLQLCNFGSWHGDIILAGFVVPGKDRQLHRLTMCKHLCKSEVSPGVCNGERRPACVAEVMGSRVASAGGGLSNGVQWVTLKWQRLETNPGAGSDVERAAGKRVPWIKARGSEYESEELQATVAFAPLSAWPSSTRTGALKIRWLELEAPAHRAVHSPLGNAVSSLRARGLVDCVFIVALAPPLFLHYGCALFQCRKFFRGRYTLAYIDASFCKLHSARTGARPLKRTLERGPVILRRQGAV